MAKLIKLTRPDGVAVWLRASEVVRVSSTIVGSASPAARTTISVGGVTQDVSEIPADVLKAVDIADG